MEGETLPLELQMLLEKAAEDVTRKYWAKANNSKNGKSKTNTKKRKFAYSPIKIARRNIASIDLAKLEAQVGDYNLEVAVYKASKDAFGSLTLEEVLKSCLNKTTMESKVDAMGDTFFIRKIRYCLCFIVVNFASRVDTCRDIVGFDRHLSLTESKELSKWILLWTTACRFGSDKDVKNPNLHYEEHKVVRREWNTFMFNLWKDILHPRMPSISGRLLFLLHCFL